MGFLKYRRSNNISHEFPWIWEYKHGVRNGKLTYLFAIGSFTRIEILMSETPSLFIGEKFGICLKTIREVSGMILIGVSTDGM